MDGGSLRGKALPWSVFNTYLRANLRYDAAIFAFMLMGAFVMRLIFSMSHRPSHYRLTGRMSPVHLVVLLPEITIVRVLAKEFIGRKQMPETDHLHNLSTQGMVLGGCSLDAYPRKRDLSLSLQPSHFLLQVCTMVRGAVREAE